MPTTAKTGAIRSATGTPTRTGGLFRSARRHHQAAQCLDDGVHGLAGARGLRRAEARDRAIDHTRVDRPRERIPDAEPIERSRAEVLDDDVGLAQQSSKHVTRARLFQVECDAVFAAKPVQRGYRNIIRARAAERHAVASEVRRVLPAWIRRLGILDLDDARAESGQEERGKRPRQRQREIEHRETRQWARR
jgi:hypothetical protein